MRVDLPLHPSHPPGPRPVFHLCCASIDSQGTKKRYRLSTVHSEDDVVVLCPLSRKLYCIRIKMSLGTGDWGRFARAAASPIRSYFLQPPPACTSDFYSLPLFSGCINWYDSVNVPSKLVINKIYIAVFCLLFTWPEVCPGALTILLHRP